METTTQPPVTLHCCHGTTPPQQIADDWKKFLDLPKLVNGRIWSLLTPALMDPFNIIHDQTDGLTVRMGYFQVAR